MIHDITAPTHDLNQLRKGGVDPNDIDNLVALKASYQFRKYRKW